MVRTPQARRDLDVMYDYIADRDPVAADALVDRIERKLGLLADNPRLGPSRIGAVGGLRTFTVPPYLLLYQPIRSGIRLVRVLHGARDIGAALDAD
ncbi:type II toxin-antitoxin system RelE/ParE family toxin [Sphingomonas liriopis]